LRAAGVPARLVGGYLGGEYNELGGYYLVSEDMAHVWVEAFISGRGWVRVDPSSFAGNAAAVWGDTPKKGLLHRLRLTIDSLDHTWNSAVITYDFESQVAVARSAGKRLQGIRVDALFTGLLPYLLALSGGVGACVILLNRKRLFPSREERLLRAFYRRVGRDFPGAVERGRVGLFELAELTGNAGVKEFAAIYAGAAYRDRTLTDEEFTRLRQIVDVGFKEDSR
jgi:hypothetical protein